MNDLQIFNNPDFGNIRATVISGEPYFVGKDVAEVLGYSNLHQQVQGILKEKAVRAMKTVIQEEKINDAIVNIRMAQAVLKFVMESSKFESKIVMDDMQDQSDGLDHVAQLLMDIRDGKEDK